MPPENNSQSTVDNQEPKTPTPPELRQIRTYQGDVASALSRQNESLVSIQQSEVLRRRANGIPAPEDSDNASDSQRGDFLFLLIGSIFFIAVGVLGAWYGYKTYLERTAPPVIAVPESRLISPSSESVLNLNNLDRLGFGAALETHLADIKKGDLKHVVIRSGALETDPLATTAELFTLLGSRAPGSLIRAFDNTFMLGAVGESQFLIIKLASFENAFAGMLSWEESMAEDLTPIFANANDLKAIGPVYVFKDVIVRNKDVRMLEVKSESVSTSTDPVQASTTAQTTLKTVLLYSFFDNNLLIITDSMETLQTLIERLTRERLSR